MSGARLRRWFLPASMITLGLGAVAFLVVLELGEDMPVSSAEEAAQNRGGEPAVTPSRGREPAAKPAPERRPQRRLKPRPAPLKKAPPPPYVRETPQVVKASGYLTQVARAKTQLERLEIIDRLAATLPEEKAAEVLTGLLDSVLPGSFQESEDLRLLVLARLGDLESPAAEHTLVARLDPEQPRPQRVMAIEMLASRPAVGRAELEAIVRDDHDLVVQQKARWALQRQVN